MQRLSLPALRFWLLSFGFWTIFGVISAMQIYVRLSQDRPETTLHSVFNIVYFYWSWALLTPVIVGVVARYRGREGWSVRRLLDHVPLLIAVLVAQGVLYALFLALDDRPSYTGVIDTSSRNVLRHLAGNVLTFVAIVASTVVVQEFRRASKLETLFARAQMGALRAQLNPHFLFNTLNMISGLVAKGDASTAHRAIARLGELLRASLDVSPDQTVSIREELALTRKYVDIAKLRFGERLTVIEKIDDAVLDDVVPPLLLQPLVENALQHGVGARTTGGTVEIRAEVQDGGVRLAVHDDGPGFAPSNGPSDGIGLENVRRRLALMYGDAATLTTRRPENGGACAAVHLPRSGS